MATTLETTPLTNNSTDVPNFIPSTSATEEQLTILLLVTGVSVPLLVVALVVVIITIITIVGIKWRNLPNTTKTKNTKL